MAKEIPKFTYEQVQEHLADAVAIVGELELEDDLRVPAFVNAVAMLMQKDVYRSEAEVMGGLLATSIGDAR